jgi:hypothetical protein
MNWQPIDSFPKDGHMVLAWRGIHATTPILAKWNSDYEWIEDEWRDHQYHLTHWCEFTSPFTQPNHSEDNLEKVLSEEQQ